MCFQKFQFKQVPGISLIIASLSTRTDAVGYDLFHFNCKKVEEEINSPDGHTFFSRWRMLIGRGQRGLIKAASETDSIVSVSRY